MPNYTASALAKAQAKYSKNFDKPELRRKQNPALMLALKNRDVTMPDHETLRLKESRPFNAYYKTKRPAGSATDKGHAHTGSKADSAEVTLTWIKIVETFAIYLKQGQSNVFDYADQLAHEIRESSENIHSRAGTLAQAFLQANRCQLAALSTGGSGSWNNSTFALEITNANSERFLQMASTFMRNQNYRGSYDLILDSSKFADVEFALQQGAGNSDNLSFQARGFESIAETIETIDPNYTTGSGLIMPAGTFAGLDWNDPANRAGKGDYDSTLGGYGVLPDPLGSGLVFDFHAYTERADGSSQGGGKQDEVLQAEVTLTIGWAVPPISTAQESVIYELAQL